MKLELPRLFDAEWEERLVDLRRVLFVLTIGEFDLLALSPKRKNCFKKAYTQRKNKI